ncbi:N-acetyl-gamma-glutamyl-phosphate reductase [hydrothermal vent metagenome]|uniref:N-acetyl-gamma-glutamyl-phosphate reductase n=1 Tax=hydrothermal vent metagenome TaxID=652676 RepID=A0A1W1C4A7_9ZZZZ
MKIKVGIVGGTGYTGIELIRLLLCHPNAEVVAVSSRSLKGQKINSLYPNLVGQTELEFCDIDDKSLFDCDVIFFATPHGVAMEQVGAFLDKNIKIIDLGADFRIQDTNIYSQYYGIEHTTPDILKTAVYGLSELNHKIIKDADLLANPGCYPTAVQLALAPLLKENHIKTDNIIADCKSGISGAGRNTNINLLYTETSESFKAYAVIGHRHLPEIEQELTKIAKKEVNITFVPHLVPMTRGILATIYVDLITDIDVQKLYEDFYKNHFFINILKQGTYPETRSVKASNFVQLSLEKTKNKLVIIASIDNLVKGASGQAIQNMNLMFNLDEKTGLTQVATIL